MIGDRSHDASSDHARLTSEPGMATAARELKKSLRKLISARLSTLTAEAIASQSRAVADAVLRHGAYRSADAIGVYLSMQRECQTDAIVAAALAAGKRVYVPRCTTKTHMSMLRLHSGDDVGAFQKTKWGIPEPPATYVAGDGSEVQREALEDAEVGTERVLVVCPGMVFSRARRPNSTTENHGGAHTGGGAEAETRLLHKRLGHGAGYYDRYLTTFNAARAADGGRARVETIGICLPCQYLGDEIGPTKTLPDHDGHGNDAQDATLEIPWTEDDVAMNDILCD